MRATEDFERALSDRERHALALLASPSKIQAFLDELRYRSASAYCCPIQVLRERMAHCFDGALFAAVALRRLGHRPLVLELVPNDRDDGHILALYKRGDCWGAVAKSNFVGLRFREPVYRTLRELVMSYFEQYYNLEREKTLRAYTLPVNLQVFDDVDWMTNDHSLECIADRLGRAHRIPLLKGGMAAKLTPVDERSYRAGLLGADQAGLHIPT